MGQAVHYCILEVVIITIVLCVTILSETVFRETTEKYICSYIVKQPISVDSYYAIVTAALQCTRKNPLKSIGKDFSVAQNNARDFYIRFYMALKTCTQVAATEVATKLLKLPMCYSSYSFKKLYAYCYFDAYTAQQKDLSFLPQIPTASPPLDTDFNSSLTSLSYYLTKNGKLKHNYSLDYINR